MWLQTDHVQPSRGMLSKAGEQPSLKVRSKPINGSYQVVNEYSFESLTGQEVGLNPIAVEQSMRKVQPGAKIGFHSFQALSAPGNGHQFINGQAQSPSEGRPTGTGVQESTPGTRALKFLDMAK